MTNSIAEISGASTIFAIGTNTTQAHPVLALQAKKAAREGANLIVANPKQIDLCRHATIHLDRHANRLRRIHGVRIAHGYHRGEDALGRTCRL